MIVKRYLLAPRSNGHESVYRSHTPYPYRSLLLGGVGLYEFGGEEHSLPWFLRRKELVKQTSANCYVKVELE